MIERTQRRPAPLEALEPRLLLAADLTAGIDLTTLLPDRGDPGPIDPAQVFAHVSARLAGNDLGETASAAAPDPLTPVDLESLQVLYPAPVGQIDASNPTEADAESQRHEVVIVDAGVDNYQQLIAELLALDDQDRRVEVYLLDKRRDGVAQVSELLSRYSGLDAVHVLSHGSGATLQLGDGQLDSGELAARGGDIRGWGKALADDADLLIYGCNVAGDADGRTFIETLGRLTGADVAASSDVTGRPESGGDWDLEYRAGVIETDLALQTAGAQKSWSGTLAIESVKDEFNAISFSGNDGSVNWVNDWQELGEADGAAAGTVQVKTNVDFATNHLRIDTNVLGRGVSRTVDLSEASAATLSFEYEHNAAGGSVSLMVSDGGAPVTLRTFEIDSGTATPVLESFDLTPYLSAGTEISLVVTDSANGGKLELDNVHITTIDADLLLSTDGDVSGGGQPGVDTFEAGDVIQIGDPDLSYTNAVTQGEFSLAFNVDLFASGARTDGVHYVTSDIQLGSSNFQLLAGDVLLSTASTESFTSASVPPAGFTNNLDVDDSDILVFRPDTPGDYTAGTFALLLEDLTGGNALRDFSLIEQATTVGDASLQAGDFLFTTSGGDNDIFLFDTTDVGPGATSGAISTLIEGDDIGVGSKLVGLHLVDSSTTLANRALAAGSLLVAVDSAESLGDNNLPVTEFDIFALEVTQTTLIAGAGNGAATASAFFDGSDVNFADEKLSGVTVTAADKLWLTTENDVSGASTPGIGDWQRADLLEFSGGDLAFEETSDGTVSVPFDIELFAPGKDVDALHTVVGDIQLGASNFQLKAGDLLLAVDEPAGATFTSGSTAPPGFTNNLTVSRADVLVFRPDTVGDYSSGSFAMLLEDPTGSSAHIHGITLVESTTEVGDATVQRGDFLFSRSSPANDEDIWLFETTDVGAGNTSGTVKLFIEGNDPGVSIAGKVVGIELIETDTTVAGRSLSEGTLLLTVDADDTVGANGLQVSPYDVFALQVSNTTLVAGAGGAVGNALLFFEGSSLGFDDADEPLSALSLTTALHVNTAPAGADDTITVDEDTDHVFSATDFGFSDPVEGDALLAVKITTLPAGGTGSLTLNGIAVTAGQLISATDIASNLLEYTPPGDANGTGLASFTFQVQDDGGTAAGGVDLDPTRNTITFDVEAVNDAPSGADKTLSTDEDIDHVFSATDFGFSDPVEGDALLAVKITTLPAGGTGSLTLNGIAVTAGQLISATDIASNLLKYTPPGNLNGTALASFTFQVQDDGGTGNGGVDLDPSANTLTIDVDAVNDAPSGTDATVSTDEDTDHVFSATDFGFSDVADGHSLLAVKITSLPAGGTGSLTLNGIAVTAGQLISATDIGSNLLKYTPPSDQNGAGLASFTFQVQDDGGTGNGGSDLDPGPNTLTIDVDAINDAPVLDNSGDMSLTNVVENNSDPAGNSVASIVSSADGNRITDVDTGAVEGMAVIGVDDANGTWEYSTNGGVSWTSFVASGVANGATDDTAAVLLVNSDLVRFVPNAAYTGSAGDITFRGWDQTTGSSGDIGVNASATGADNAFSIAEETASLTVTESSGVTNLVPGNQNVDEDGMLVFSVANGNSIVIDDGEPGDRLVRTTLAVSNGVLNLATTAGITIESGGNGTAGMTVSGLESAVNAALDGLKFTPTPEFNGADNLQVTTALAGDTVARYTFDPPAAPGDDSSPGGANDGVVNNATVVFDPSRPGDVLFFNANDNVEIAGLLGKPASVTLAAWVNLDAFETNEEVISLGDNIGLRLDQAGLGVMGFFFDGVGTQIVSSGVFVAGTGWHHVAFSFDDATNVQVLYIDGSPVAAGGFAGPIDYASRGPNTVLGAHGNGGGPVFGFDGRMDDVRVYDRAVSAADIASIFSAQDSEASTVPITVDPVNDEPSGADNTLTIDEDIEHMFSVADFGFSDPVEGDSLLAVKLTTLPALGTGTLTLNGVAVTVGQSVSAADIASNLLKYEPPSDQSGVGLASFTFQVQDDGGTANGGIDLDQSPNTFTFNVEAVNDAPSGADKTLSTDEDTDHVFSATDFGFSDPVESDSLLAVKITTLPALGTGTLTLNGVAVTAGQLISAADITSNVFKYEPPSNQNGAGLASFTFQVRDDGGTGNGGVDLDQSANTITVDVDAVNDEPVGSDDTVGTDEDIDLVFKLADFGFSDPADGDALQAIKVSSLPGSGTLTNNGVPVVVGQLVSAADIAANLFRYSPPDDANGAGLASFTFQVRDDGGTANGGIDLDATPNTLSIDVTPVNDAPGGTDNTVSTTKDVDLVFAVTDFGFSDPVEGDSLNAVKINGLPVTGTLTLNGVPVLAGQFINAADIASNLFKYTPPAGITGDALAAFDFQVADDGGTANGGVDLDPSANTITIDVNKLNSAPAGQSNTVFTLEDTDRVFSAADFGFSDPVDGHALKAVQIVAVSGVGKLTSNGNPVAPGEVVSAADIAAGLLRYAPPADAHGAALAGFRFQVQDDGGTANGGIDLDPSPNNIAIDVKSVNDAPAGADVTLNTNVDEAVVLAIADFGFSDAADGNSFVAVRISSLPAQGVLTLAGAPVGAGQLVSAGAIAAGQLVYQPPAGVSGPAVGAFGFQVLDNAGTANGGQNIDPSPNRVSINVNAGPLIATDPPAPSEDPDPPATAPDPETELEAPPAEPAPPVDTASPAPVSLAMAALPAVEDTPPFEDVTTPLKQRDGGGDDAVKNLLGALIEAVSAQLSYLPPDLIAQTLDRLDDVTDLADQGEFLEALDRVRNEVNTATALNAATVSTTTAAGALSVGYVAWLLRGGLLLTSFLSSMPAWRLIDPIPVLAYLDDEEDEHAESLSSIVEQHAAEVESAEQAERESGDA